MKLVFFVTLAHVLLLFCFNLNKEIKPSKKNKIVVRTEKLRPLPTVTSKAASKAIVEQAPPKVVVESKPVIAEKKVEVKKAATTPPKKKAATTPAKPKESGSKAPPKTAHKADKELLSLMKEGLNKIDKASNSLQKQGSDKGVKKIGPLKSESNEETAEELSYAEELALYLKHHLHFPEEGKMKLALTLSREGQLDNFKILSSTSEGNKSLALKSISTIAFPPFKDRFKERTKTFTIQINIDNK